MSIEGKFPLNGKQKEGSKNHHEEAEKLYEEVDKKIKMILELRGFAESISEKSVEDLEIITQKKFEEIKAGFNRSVMEKLKLREDREKRIDDIEDEIGEEAYFDDEWDKLNKEIEIIKEDEDVMFLDKVQDFLDDLVKKRRAVLNYQKKFSDSPDKLLRVFLKKAEIVPAEVKYNGYNVDIFLESDDYDKVVDKVSLGRHVSGTPVNIIKLTEDNKSTVVHEHNHNLSESFTGEFCYSEQFLKKIKTCASSMDRKDLMGDIGEFKLIDNFRKYVYANLNEIIADIDAMENGRLSSHYFVFLEAVKNIEEFKDQVKNEKARKIIESELDAMKEEYAEFVAKISSLFFSAKKTGTVEKLKGGIILFGTKKIGKVERQMRHGDSNFEIYQKLNLLTTGNIFKNMGLDAVEKLLKGIFGSTRSLKQLIDKKTSIDSFFKIKNLEELAKLLDNKNEINLTSEEINNCGKNIIKYVYEGNNNEYFDKLVKNKNEFLHFESLIKRISTILGVKEMEKLSENILDGFLRRRLDDAIEEDDFSEFENLYHEWPYDKAIFNNLLKDSKDNPDQVLTIYEISNFDPEEEIEEEIIDIKQTSFWKFLERIGMVD